MYHLRLHSEPIRINNDRRYSPIRILDDVLLNIFHLYRQADLDEHDNKPGTTPAWYHQHWWYRLAHVCRQWRNVILESPSRLDLHLYCTNCVPVAKMLAHSPPLPLTICYHSTYREITAEDESGIFLALSHRDRVHHIHFDMLPGKFVTVMDDQFPILECMVIHSRTEVVLPVTFQAPNLRHLMLLPSASLPIGSPLLTTTAGLITLLLLHIPASAYFPPSYILTRLSLMAQLKTLSIVFLPPFPYRDVESQLHQTPDTITLPNLHQFWFGGTATYLESLVAWISAPSLSILRVLLNQLPLPVPRLCQFIQSSENLTFRVVQVTFGAFAVCLHAVPWKRDTPLVLQIGCEHLDYWQVVSMVQFFGSLSPVFRFVEQVAFSYDGHYHPPEWLNNVDRSQWREILRPFANVKTIHVDNGLINKIFRTLQSDDGEPPLELLPNLEEIGYSGGSDPRDAFTRFLSERQVSGHPAVSLRLVDRSIFEIPPYL